MLAEHPDIESRLRHEVFDKVGPVNRPTYDNMREMKFMRAFLNGKPNFFFFRCAEGLIADFFAVLRGTETLSACVSYLRPRFLSVD